MLVCPLLLPPTILISWSSSSINTSFPFFKPNENGHTPIKSSFKPIYFLISPYKFQLTLVHRVAKLFLVAGSSIHFALQFWGLLYKLIHIVHHDIQYSTFIYRFPYSLFFLFLSFLNIPFTHFISSLSWTTLYSHTTFASHLILLFCSKFYKLLTCGYPSKKIFVAMTWFSSPPSEYKTSILMEQTKTKGKKFTDFVTCVAQKHESVPVLFTQIHTLLPK